MWMSAQYSTIHTTHGKKPSLKPGKEESANKQQTQKKNINELQITIAATYTALPTLCGDIHFNFLKFEFVQRSVIASRFASRFAAKAVEGHIKEKERTADDDHVRAHGVACSCFSSSTGSSSPAKDKRFCTQSMSSGNVAKRPRFDGDSEGLNGRISWPWRLLCEGLSKMSCAADSHCCEGLNCGNRGTPLSESASAASSFFLASSTICSRAD